MKSAVIGGASGVLAGLGVIVFILAGYGWLVQIITVSIVFLVLMAAFGIGVSVAIGIVRDKDLKQ